MAAATPIVGPSAKASRPYDVVVWGATGFTGRLVAEYMARHYGVKKELAWAIAGRSREKLEQVRAGLRAIDPDAVDLPLLTGDSADRASLDAITSSTRVVATTVGPYAIHGHELAASCVENGTDSCDLTGEPQFIVDLIERHHARARETGARIVNCCGFDSIPSDLGTLLLQTEMQARHATRCAEVKFVLVKMRGGFSGGTAASALHMAEAMSEDPRLRRVIANPYSLDPERTERGPDGPDQRGPRWDEDLQTWTGPFVMAAINTRVVRRSNALLGYAWGKDFRYSESAAFSKGPRGFLGATALGVGLGAFIALAAIGPTRKLLARVLPSPGEGPTQAQRENGFFEVKLVGRSSSNGRGRALVATLRGQSDPGYGETAKMLTESAVCLAKDGLESPGGVLTPASCMGLKLKDRLHRAGMTFDVEAMASR